MACARQCFVLVTKDSVGTFHNPTQALRDVKVVIAVGAPWG
jgi:hypothetical protein